MNDYTKFNGDISLQNTLKIIIKRKKLFMLIVVVCVIAGSYFASLRQNRYGYRQVIGFGRYCSGNKNVETVLRRRCKVAILAPKKYFLANINHNIIPRGYRSPLSSNIIQLSNQTTLNEKESIADKFKMALFFVQLQEQFFIVKDRVYLANELQRRRLEREF